MLTVCAFNVVVESSTTVLPLPPVTLALNPIPEAGSLSMM